MEGPPGVSQPPGLAGRSDCYVEAVSDPMSAGIVCTQHAVADPGRGGHGLPIPSL